MLTQEQKDQLTVLMNECPHSKLKKVLNEALPRFISGEIEPIQHTTGLSCESDGKWRAEYDKCCLIGAALIGKSTNKRIIEEFNISESENESIIYSFDGHCVNNFNYYNSEIVEYVAKIRKVIFGC